MLSYHFARSEFACKCDCGFDTADVELVEVLEGVAEHFKQTYGAAYVFILINSGCRCIAHNDAVQRRANPDYVNGTSDSMHLRGSAADFRVKLLHPNGSKGTVPPEAVADYLEGKYPKLLGIGRYRTWTHVDMKSGQHRRWGKN